MEPGGFQTQISDPRKAEKQMRQGWDDLSEELKREYGKDYLEKGKYHFKLNHPSPCQNVNDSPLTIVL